MKFIPPLIGLFLFAGWVMNIIKLISIVNDPVTGMLILRAFGIPFIPLGGVLGWL